MTLRLKEDGAVGAVLLLEAIRTHATLTLTHRRKGLMLLGVSTSARGGFATQLRTA
jgi:hypothetical protein